MRLERGERGRPAVLERKTITNNEGSLCTYYTMNPFIVDVSPCRGQGKRCYYE